MTMWDDLPGMPSGGNHRTRLSEFLLDTVYGSVDASCSTVDDAAFHAIHRIGADHFFRRIQTDMRQL